LRRNIDRTDHYSVIFATAHTNESLSQPRGSVSKSTANGQNWQKHQFSRKGSFGWRTKRNMASNDEIDAEYLRLRVKLAQKEQDCSNAGEDMLSAEMSPLLQQRRAMQ
jgi:hypothetical protein